MTLENNFENISNISIHQKENLVYVNSVYDNIEEIEVFDLLGRRVIYKNNIKNSAFNFSTQGVRNQVLTIKTTTNKTIKTTKIITN